MGTRERFVSPLNNPIRLVVPLTSRTLLVGPERLRRVPLPHPGAIDGHLSSHNVSPDGRWFLFTSNSGKSLGANRDPSAVGPRRDVFLVDLCSAHN